MTLLHKRKSGMLSGLSQINIELTSRCNKACFFCGHQNPKVNTSLVFGDIDFGLLKLIACQLPKGVVVQFHRDGEPTIYPRLTEALDLFKGQIRSIVTNGKNLADRAADILEYCERITVSAFAGDPDGQEQRKQLRQFLVLKGGFRLPAVNIKIVGEMVPELEAEYVTLGVPILRRLLHHPAGDWRYRKGAPTIPEAMICQDLLSHPSVDWGGNFYICNRLQPAGHGKLGNLNYSSLEELWNSTQRLEWIQEHINMNREAVPACRGCEFWGIPTG